MVSTSRVATRGSRSNDLSNKEIAYIREVVVHVHQNTPSNGWSEQNGTIDEAIADLRREGGDNFTIEEDNRLPHFRVVSMWMVGPDGKGDECFFIEPI